ncbi:hypothetical protein LUZ60_017248 [Juncus effusus]|nr:hypothetical protein LUZ60_017248 [Juncus effusus]
MAASSSKQQLRGMEFKQEEKLELRGMYLNTIPKISINFSAIKSVNISGNNLEEIAESVTARLLNVVDLEVHSNRLKSLPNSIGCLIKLRRLNFSGNLITSLPYNFRLCKAIEELNGNFNLLTTLSVSFGYEHPKLKYLYLSSNKISFLPNSITQLAELKLLDLGLNKLHQLPEEMENLTKLEVLIIRQNFQFLRKLPFGIGILRNLKEFDMSYNRISVLPHSMCCLVELRVFKTEGNPIKSPPMEVINQGISPIRSYLSRKMKGIEENPNSNKSWLNKVTKCGTFGSGHIKWKSSESPRHFDDDYIRFERRNVEAVASPRFLDKISPRNIFKSRRK